MSDVSKVPVVTETEPGLQLGPWLQVSACPQGSSGATALTNE